MFLDAKIVTKPVRSELFNLGLNNISFKGFMLYLSFALFYYYTGCNLIILVYLLHTFGDLFVHLPNILLDFMKLHSLARSMIRILDSYKSVSFKKNAFLINTSVYLSYAATQDKTVHRKFIPHLSLRSGRFLPYNSSNLTYKVRSLVSKQVFNSPIFNAAVSLVEKGTFRSTYLISMGKRYDVPFLKIMVIECNKILCEYSLPVKCNDLEYGFVSVKAKDYSLKSFLSNFDNNAYLNVAVKEFAKKELMVYMQAGQFSNNMGDLAGPSNVRNLSRLSIMGNPYNQASMPKTPQNILAPYSTLGLPKKGIRFQALIVNKVDFILNLEKGLKDYVNDKNIETFIEKGVSIGFITED